jgi:hypothetical protein
MLKQDQQAFIQSTVISSPCSVGWENMTGDDTVRFCNQCSLNVYNISDMSDEQAVQILEKRKTSRVCVFMYRDANGTIVTDNCPRSLRPVRNNFYGYATSILLTLTWCLGSATFAQDLIGPPVDPRYFQSNGFPFQDFGYDTARDISRAATAVSFLIALIIPLDKRKRANLKLVALELLALTAIPILVHVIGTFAINNYGGLGGGF